MDDVMRFSNKTMGPEFLDNNYKASFVEQEIGFSKSSFIFFYLSDLEYIPGILGFSGFFDLAKNKKIPFPKKSHPEANSDLKRLKYFFPRIYFLPWSVTLVLDSDRFDRPYREKEPETRFCIESRHER